MHHLKTPQESAAKWNKNKRRVKRTEAMPLVNNATSPLCSTHSASAANGTTFATREDEIVVTNVMLFPSVWKHFRQTAQFATVMMAGVRFQSEGDGIHVVCEWLDDADQIFEHIAPKARKIW